VSAFDTFALNRARDYATLYRNDSPIWMLIFDDQGSEKLVRLAINKAAQQFKRVQNEKQESI